MKTKSGKRHVASAKRTPWLSILRKEREKSERFDAPLGKVTLTDLFDGRSQLVTYHFMLGPDRK